MIFCLITCLIILRLTFQLLRGLVRIRGIIASAIRDCNARTNLQSHSRSNISPNHNVTAARPSAVHVPMLIKRLNSGNIHSSKHVRSRINAHIFVTVRSRSHSTFCKNHVVSVQNHCAINAIFPLACKRRHNNIRSVRAHFVTHLLRNNNANCSQAKQRSGTNKSGNYCHKRTRLSAKNRAKKHSRKHCAIRSHTRTRFNAHEAPPQDAHAK